MSDRDTRLRKKAMLVSYFFYPSTEVGAKRTSELALSLQVAGARVRVIHGKSKRFIKTDPQLAEQVRGLRTHSVIVPLKVTDHLWAAIKRLRRKRSGEPSDSGKSIPELSKPVPARPDNLSFRQFVRRQILAFEIVFGGRKFWCLLVWLRVLYLRVLGRADVVISSGPPMASYLGGIFASWVNRCPWVMDMRDPWFLNRQAGRVAEGHWLLRFEDWTARQCIRRSDSIVCASPGITKYIRENFTEYKNNAIVIRNGFDEHTRLADAGPVGRLSMLYSGTLYLNRDPFPFLEALQEVVDSGIVHRDAISFLFVGKCRVWNGISLIEWLEERGLDDVVSVRDFVPSAELQTLVADANVLVNFSQGQVDQIPAKTYEYIASGRQFVVIAEPESDSADLIRDVPSGRLIEPTDATAMTEYLREMIELFVNERTAYRLPMKLRDEFSREAQNSKYIAYLSRQLDNEQE